MKGVKDENKKLVKFFKEGEWYIQLVDWDTPLTEKEIEEQEEIIQELGELILKAKYEKLN